MRWTIGLLALSLAACGRSSPEQPAQNPSPSTPAAAVQVPSPTPETVADVDVDAADQLATKPKLRVGDVIRFPRGMIACRSKNSLSDEALLSGGGTQGCVGVQAADELKVISVSYEKQDPDSALMWVRSSAIPFPKAFIVSADDSLWERVR